MLLQNPVGQQLSVADITDLLTYLVQQAMQPDLPDVAAQLLKHPAGQQLSTGALIQLLQVTVWDIMSHDSNPMMGFDKLACMCMQHPGAASMTAGSICQLLQLFAGRTGMSSAVSQLLWLPAAQQFPWDRIKCLLSQACPVW
jgi:hypothetical protein